MTRASPEHEIQAAFFAALPILAGQRVFAFAVPNEGKRSKYLGAKMRAAGLTSGAPDVCAVWWDEAAGRSRVMWLEFKAPKGRVTKPQADFHDLLKAHGHMVEVVRSVEDALAALRAQGAPVAEVKG